MINGKKILVVGAGGFIGGHLVNRLLKDGLTKTYNWIYSELKKDKSNINPFTKS